MKIYIVGSTGTGKTTLCRLLGSKLSVPSYDLDDFCYSPNWVTKPIPQFIEDVETVLKTERERPSSSSCGGGGWVFCGNYRHVQSQLIEECDLTLWLDYPIWTLVLPRLLFRTFQRIFWRVPCCNGNYESFYKAFFTKRSIILLLLTEYWKKQRKYADMMTRGDDERVRNNFVRLRSDQETQNFVDQLLLRHHVKIMDEDGV